jgi:hypothetical protein
MTVRMLQSMVGPTLSLSGGDLYACDDATAERLIAAGVAQVVTPAAPETAMVEPQVEWAVKPKGRAR